MTPQAPVPTTDGDHRASADVGASRSISGFLRGQRAEILVAIALMSLVALSAVVVASHLAAVAPSDACWQAHFSDVATTPSPESCRTSMNVYLDVQHSEVSKVIGLAAFVPFFVGLLLGVPIVGRGWGPTDERGGRRWLASRILTMLVILLVGLSITIALVTMMWHTAEPWGPSGPGRDARLDDLTFAPLSFVARGLLAFGVALLTGAVLRRTLPAYAAASLVLLVIVIAGGWGLHGIVAERVAVWETHCDPRTGTCEDPDWLYYLGTGFVDTDGTILSPDEAHAVMLERCPTCGADGDDGWVWANLPDAWRIAPVDSYDTFVAAEALTWSVIGLACIVLTFPVAAWRRPGRRRPGRGDHEAVGT